MSNLVPFGKNTPPTSPGYPGGLRPPVNNGLNSWSGPTWRNPANPVQVKPPPTSPISRLPPKLPPLPKGPGLGLLTVIKPNIPSLLLLGGLFLLSWWLSQPDPPPLTTPPPSPVFQLNPLKSYLVEVDTEIQVDGTNYRGSLIGEVISGVSGVTYPVFFPNHPSGGTCYGWSFSNPAGSQFSRRADPVVFPSFNSSKAGVAVHLFRITDLTNNQLLPPLPPPTGPTPPYALAPTRPNAPPLTSPGPQNPTPSNPAPLGNPPGTVPSFTPFPGPGKNKSDDEKKQPSPWFTPFPAPYGPFNEPFNFNPDPTPTTTGPFVTNDPVVNFAPNRAPDPLKHPTSEPGSNPNPNPNPNPPNSKKPTTTEPPDPNKDKNPLPFFPPFPIINPQDPTIQNREESKAPIIQTPSGNNCCVPTPVDQKLNDANNKLDLLTPTLQAIDLSVLKVINDKLGPQVNGGLSGFLTDRFTKLWNSRVIDRALNLMAVGASLHNAIMLSRDLGTTLIETTGNVLAAVGIKNADGEAFDFNTIIGETVENFVKSAVGTENYTKLKQTWVKANRILTAGANLIDSVRSMQNTIIEAQEIVGGWVAKIGNGLSQDGVVNDNTIDWMPEKPDFKNPFFRAQETIENLTEAAESVNQLASAVIETQELTKQINDNYKAFKDEMTVKSNEKKDKENDKKEESESPDINKSDLKEGTP